jgi:RNA polymerase sigma-70 factor, ECF subfamily
MARRPPPADNGAMPDAPPATPIPGPEPVDWTGDRDYLAVLAHVTVPPWLRPRVDPSDVVQQSLVNAVTHRDQFRGAGPGPRRAWLRQILANVIRDAARKHRGPAGLERAVQVALDESSRRLDALLAAEQSGPGERAQKLEDLRRLTDGLARLPPDQRTAVELKHLRGWTVRQIADHLGRGPEAVGGLLRRGMRALRDDLAGDAPGSR